MIFLKNFLKYSFLLTAWTQSIFAANQIEQIENISQTCSVSTSTLSVVDCYKEKWSYDTFVIYSNYLEFAVSSNASDYVVSFPVLMTSTDSGSSTSSFTNETDQTTNLDDYQTGTY